MIYIFKKQPNLYMWSLPSLFLVSCVSQCVAIIFQYLLMWLSADLWLFQGPHTVSQLEPISKNWLCVPKHWGAHKPLCVSTHVCVYQTHWDRHSPCSSEPVVEDGESPGPNAWHISSVVMHTWTSFLNNWKMFFPTSNVDVSVFSSI